MSYEINPVTEKSVSIWMSIHERLAEEERRSEREIVSVLYGLEGRSR